MQRTRVEGEVLRNNRTELFVLSCPSRAYSWAVSPSLPTVKPSIFPAIGSFLELPPRYKSNLPAARTGEEEEEEA